MYNPFKTARLTYNRHGRQSVKAVSEATGITKSLIDDLESSSPRGVSYLKIKTLAEYYGVSSDYLLGLHESPTTKEEAILATNDLTQDLDAMEEAMSRTADRADIWQDRIIYATAKAVWHLLKREIRRERDAQAGR